MKQFFISLLLATVFTGENCDARRVSVAAILGVSWCPDTPRFVQGGVPEWWDTTRFGWEREGRRGRERKGGDGKGGERMGVEREGRKREGGKGHPTFENRSPPLTSMKLGF